MVVAPAYFTERAIFLSLSVPCFTISILEIIASYSGKSVNIKQRIHFVCLFAAFAFVLSIIDPDGVFGMFPAVVGQMTGSLSSLSLTGGFGLIIYSHYQAHFNTLHEKPPTFIPKLLTGPYFVLLIFNQTGEFLAWYYQKVIFNVMKSFGSMILVGIYMCCEWYGYYLIRKMILEVKKGRMAPKNTKSISSEKTPSKRTNDYDVMLCHILKFHIIMTLGIIIFFSLTISGLLTTVKAPSAPPVYRRPEEYKISSTIFAFLMLWIVESWWGWVPLSPLFGFSVASKTEDGSHITSDDSGSNSRTKSPGGDVKSPHRHMSKEISHSSAPEHSIQSHNQSNNNNTSEIILTFPNSNNVDRPESPDISPLQKKHTLESDLLSSSISTTESLGGWQVIDTPDKSIRSITTTVELTSTVSSSPLNLPMTTHEEEDDEEDDKSSLPSSPSITSLSSIAEKDNSNNNNNTSTAPSQQQQEETRLLRIEEDERDEPKEFHKNKLFGINISGGEKVEN